MTLPTMSSRGSVDRMLPGIQEVMGSIPVGDSIFFLTHACVMLINSPFKFLAYFGIISDANKLGCSECPDCIWYGLNVKTFQVGMHPTLVWMPLYAKQVTQMDN